MNRSINATVGAGTSVLGESFFSAVVVVVVEVDVVVVVVVVVSDAVVVVVVVGAVFEDVVVVLSAPEVAASVLVVEASVTFSEDEVLPEVVVSAVVVVVVVSAVVVVVEVVVSAGIGSPFMVTFLPLTSPLSPTGVTLPFSTINTISGDTSYPSGANSSWRVYIPSGTFLMNVGVEPDFHTRFSPEELMDSAPSPSTRF